jgi:hypothetical protein
MSSTRNSVRLPNGTWLITRHRDSATLSVCVREPSIGDIPIAHVATGWVNETELDIARAIKALPVMVDALGQLPPHLTRRPPTDAECHKGTMPQTRCPECSRYMRLLDARDALGMEPVYIRNAK